MLINIEPKYSTPKLKFSSKLYLKLERLYMLWDEFNTFLRKWIAIYLAVRKWYLKQTTTANQEKYPWPANHTCKMPWTVKKYERDKKGALKSRLLRITKTLGYSWLLCILKCNISFCFHQGNNHLTKHEVYKFTIKVGMCIPFMHQRKWPDALAMPQYNLVHQWRFWSRCLPGSCPPNWLHGNARTSRPEL